VTDSGEETLRAATRPGCPGDTNGHCFQNARPRRADPRGRARVPGDAGFYSDIDMVAPAGGKPRSTPTGRHTHQDIRRRGP